jgi:hypothetical protein
VTAAAYDEAPESQGDTRWKLWDRK